MKSRAISPVKSLLAGAFGCLIVLLAALFLCTRTPWLGLTLSAPTGEGGIRIVGARGPSVDVPIGGSLVWIGRTEGSAIELEATDVIDEPDYFDRYAEMDRFFGRQTEIDAVLRSERVTLGVRRADGPVESFVVRPAPRRPLSDLPGELWFQLGAGAIGFLVSLWVFVLRPRVTAIQMFALAGAMIFGFTAPAAVYSTRELALHGRLFRALSSLNHLDANLFGIGLVGIFVMFPTPLVKPRALWALPLVFVSWFVLDAARIAPDQNWGARLPILLEMLLAIGLAIVQWRRAKSDARARAALRWFGVSVLTGASLFVFSVVAPKLLGGLPPIPQGYSFGFFLLMHVGLALGLRQTRLFELNELAYIVLFWVLGAIALVALDAAVLMALDTNHLVSSALALFAVGLAYVPVRSWAWSKFVSQTKVDEAMLFRRVLDVVFALDLDVRAGRWRDLFETLFLPLEISPATNAGHEPTEVTIQDDGLALVVPAVTTLPALRLALPWKGRGLFGERHAKLVASLVELAAHAENARDAFDRGVREERARVARDLHDDVGAALTSALYQHEPDAIHQTVRSAIHEMRSMVSQLTSRRLRAVDVVGDLRHEALDRLSRAGISPTWPLVDLGEATIHSAVARNFGSMVRELTSNVIRHSGASAMTVDIRLEKGHLVTLVSDDGKGFESASPSKGNGLRNVRRRAGDLGGSVVFTRLERGTSVRLELPLVPAARAEEATRS